MGNVKPAIIIHGGAWDIPTELHSDHQNGIQLALEKGREILKRTNDSVRAVVETVKVLEDFPVFDAGTGSFLNNTGDVEMDAGVMCGSDLSCGAVAAIRNIKNPIEIANLVREKTQHCLLSGMGALNFAVQQGQETCETEELLVGREKERYLKLRGKKKVIIKSFFEKGSQSRDTVGAVAINSDGKIAAGTSTGGTPLKKEGRVGDSPIPGAGFYADDTIAGVSATGWGEGILRTLLSKTAIEYIASGLSLRSAAKKALRLMKEKVDGQGGLILIDKSGTIEWFHTTPYMAVGAADSDGIRFAKVSAPSDID